jgi:hypothetical protein
VAAARRLCPRLPDGMADDLAELLTTATTDLNGLPGRVGRLLDRLDALLVAEGLIAEVLIAEVLIAEVLVAG